MPSPTKKRGRRTQIRDWRVKHEKKEVFVSQRKGDCLAWIREHCHLYRGHLRLIEPNGPK